jgi:hypothetical protein
MTMARIVAALAVAMVAGLVATPGAGATFPGRAGELMWSWSWSDKAIQGGSGVSGVDIGTGTGRAMFECSWGLGVGCWAEEAAVSADGERLVVSVVDSGGFGSASHRLAVVTLSNGDERSVPLSRPTYDPAWSPDGEMVLVTRYDGKTGERNDGGAPHLGLLATSDGGERGQVGPSGASDADWAITGDIAYVQRGNIWITRLEGATQQLTTAGGAAPSWSPDGDQIAFERGGHIWAMRADGGDQRRISNVEATALAWSPDGRHIAFSHPEGLSAALWVMHADGRCARVVRRAGVWTLFTDPFWQPLPGSPARTGRPTCGARPLAKPDMTRSPRRVRVTRSALRYRFRTVPGVAGHAVFRTRANVVARTRRGVVRRHLTLARVRFSAGPKGVVRLRPRLSQKNMRILRGNNSLQLRAIVTVRDEAGDSATARRRLTVVVPHARRL